MGKDNEPFLKTPGAGVRYQEDQQAMSTDAPPSVDANTAPFGDAVDADAWARVVRLLASQMPSRGRAR